MVLFLARFLGAIFFVMGMVASILGGSVSGTVSAQLFSGWAMTVSGVLLGIYAELVLIRRKQK
ncbi:MAG: hypothetical protein AAB486_04760 [Patescibacteria group bacterium]